MTATGGFGTELAPQRERTRQQLDPSGSVGLTWVTRIFVAGAFGYGCLMTSVGRLEVQSPFLAIVALIALAAACVVVVVSSSPYRSPLRRRVHVVALFLVMAAYGLEILSQWEKNARVRDDWGPVCVGLILVALSSYRPAADIVTSGVLSAIFIGFFTLLQVPHFRAAAPPITFVTLAVTPMLALCFAAAAFAHVAVIGLLRRHEDERTASQALVAEAKKAVARSVEKERVSELSHEVLPFLSDLLSRELITDDDRLRAGQIAATVRTLMVQEVERSWLASLSMRGVAVHDNDQAAAAMTTEQRTAIRAFLVAVAAASGTVPPRVKIALSRGAVLFQGTLSAQFTSTQFASGMPTARFDFVSLVAEMRAAFVEIQFDHDPTTLRLRFTYEQR